MLSKVFKRFVRIWLLVLLTVLMLINHCSCGPSLEVQYLMDQGKLPDSKDFPNTKWVCRELDMYFYMLDYGENSMIGEYTANGVKYRIIGSTFFNDLDIRIIASTDIAESDTISEVDGTSFISTNIRTNTFARIETNYIYENGTINCSVRGSDLPDDMDIPKTLTFENRGEIAQQPSVRWQAEELPMYINFFNDADGYLKGEIEINGKNTLIYGFESGNCNYYKFYVKDGNYFSPLANMHLEFLQSTIVAKVDVITVSDNISFKRWQEKRATITFRQDLAE